MSFKNNLKQINTLDAHLWEKFGIWRGFHFCTPENVHDTRRGCFFHFSQNQPPKQKMHFKYVAKALNLSTDAWATQKM